MGAADIVRRQAEAQNKYDFDTVVGFFADKVSWTDPTDHVDGLDAVRTKYDTLYSMFPDGQVELGTVVEQGDICMYEEAFRGTNTGDMILPDGTVHAGHRQAGHGRLHGHGPHRGGQDRGSTRSSTINWPS